MRGTLPTAREYAKATYKSTSTVYNRLRKSLLFSTKESNLPVFASIYNSLTSADYVSQTKEPEPVVITDDAVEVRATEVTEAEVTNGTLECLRSKAYDGEFASPSEVAPSEDSVSPYQQAIANIEKAKALVEDISKQKPSKARDKRLGTAQLAVTEAHVPLLHYLFPKLQTHEYKLADYREIADQLTCTDSLSALDWFCLGGYRKHVFRLVFRKYQGERANRELRKAESQLEETSAYIKERWQTVANTTALDIAGYTVEATKTKAGSGYSYSIRVRIAPGIYSRSYATDKPEDTMQLAQDYPAITHDNFMEAYLSLPRVSLGEETLVQLPNNLGTLREVGGMVDLSSLGGAFGLTED